MTVVHRNHPFLEVVKGAEQRIKQGWTVFQKFSCEKCMARLEMPEPNKFFTTGTCDQCGHLTDILKSGCNYAAIWSSAGPNALLQLIVQCRDDAETERLKQMRAKMQ